MSVHSDKAKQSMEKCIEALKNNFGRVRTGRANPHALDHIKVDYYGQPTPISQLAAIKVPEASMLLVEPWDKTALKSIEKAIETSDLGITPSNDGSAIRLPFPMPTEERRRELAKECSQIAEEARVAVRNVHTDKLVQYFSDAPEDISLSDINLETIPSHVSIIMDGNGRWATARGLDRTEGHKAGVLSLREAVTTSVRLGLDALSVYAFSTENWKRPQREVDLLMRLFAETLLKELPLFHQENVKLRFFGDLEALPEKTRKTFQRGLDETAQNTGMTFALAVNYGSRAELTRAAVLLANQISEGAISADSVTPADFEKNLYTTGLPDPDLLIRTSGELRLSNYLLWQLAYSELYVTQTYWPDFSKWDFLRAIKDYQGRERRFGGVK